MKTVLLEIIYSHERPIKSGVYSCRYYDKKQNCHITRRIFYDVSIGQFKLKNGRSSVNIDRWYLPVQVDNDTFEFLKSKK